ncbi:hypothetical protein [Bacillus safensis]|uniref:hypothetical protein n=1 Tax=Bacillus safensis TaxID=561879 RepID=UPI002E1E4041|nr:hypothetical protein [Bacillus safensis]
MIHVVIKGGRRFKDVISPKVKYSVPQCNLKLVELENYAEENDIYGDIEIIIYEDKNILFRDSYNIGQGVSRNLLLLVNTTLNTTFKDTPKAEKELLINKLMKEFEKNETAQGELEVRRSTFKEKFTTFRENRAAKARAAAEAKAVEEARAAAEAKAAEEARAAAEAKAAEEARAAAEAKAAEEARAAAEAKAAEEARAAAEAKAAEEARAAAEAKAAEEARAAAEAKAKDLYLLKDEILEEIKKEKLDLQQTIELQKLKQLKEEKEQKKQDKYLRKLKKKQYKINPKPVKFLFFIAVIILLVLYIDPDIVNLFPFPNEFNPLKVIEKITGP